MDTYLQPDGSAESPLPDYPGAIKFPLVMTLAMHKRWQAWVNGKTERDPDAPRVGVVFAEGEQDESDSGRIPFLYDDVELAQMFGELKVTAPDGRKLTQKTPADDLPIPVATWIAKCYREWENSQVMFRWNGVVRMATPDGPA